MDKQKKETQKVTLKDIAKQLNLSVGTVDRAIHGRGRISAKTKSLIMKKINELGYKPNKIARALGKNEATRIAFLTPAHNRFWQEVIKGAETACNELSDYNVHLDLYPQDSDFDTLGQIKKMEDAINEHPNGIIIAPLHPFLLSTPIDKAVDNGIPVVTVNLDSKGSKRLCYVGENAYHAGSLIALLFGKYFNGEGDIAVLSGNAGLSQFNVRKEGFLDTINSIMPKVNIIGYFEYSDNEEIAFEISKKIITDVPGIKGIFANTTVGAIGIGRAIREMGRQGSIVSVCYDYSDEIKELLDCNALFATVTQNPYQQGYYAVKLLYKSILEKVQPENEFNYTHIDIIINSKQYDFNAAALGNDLLV